MPATYDVADSFGTVYPTFVIIEEGTRALIMTFIILRGLEVVLM